MKYKKYENDLIDPHMVVVLLAQAHNDAPAGAAHALVSGGVQGAIKCSGALGSLTLRFTIAAMRPCIDYSLNQKFKSVQSSQ